MNFVITLKTRSGEQATYWCEDFELVPGVLILQSAESRGRDTISRFDSIGFPLDGLSFWGVNQAPAEES